MWKLALIAFLGATLLQVLTIKQQKNELPDWVSNPLQRIPCVHSLSGNYALYGLQIICLLVLSHSVVQGIFWSFSTSEMEEPLASLSGTWTEQQLQLWYLYAPIIAVWGLVGCMILGRAFVPIFTLPIDVMMVCGSGLMLGILTGQLDLVSPGDPRPLDTSMTFIQVILSIMPWTLSVVLPVTWYKYRGKGWLTQTVHSMRVIILILIVAPWSFSGITGALSHGWGNMTLSQHNPQIIPMLDAPPICWKKQYRWQTMHFVDQECWQQAYFEQDFNDVSWLEKNYLAARRGSQENGRMFMNQAVEKVTPAQRKRFLEHVLLLAEAYDRVQRPTRWADDEAQPQSIYRKTKQRWQASGALELTLLRYAIDEDFDRFWSRYVEAYQGKDPDDSLFIRPMVIRLLDRHGMMPDSVPAALRPSLEEKSTGKDSESAVYDPVALERVHRRIEQLGLPGVNY